MLIFSLLWIPEENWSQNDCHSKMFPLKFFISNFGSLTFISEAEGSIVETDGARSETVEWILFKLRSNFAIVNIILSSLYIISSSSFSFSSGFNKFKILPSSSLISLNFSWKLCLKAVNFITESSLCGSVSC